MLRPRLVVGRPSRSRYGSRTAAGAVLEDPVLHQLHARRAVAVRCRPSAALDQLVDLLRAALAVPPQRPDDPRGQLAPSGQRRVGDLLLVGGDDRVLPVGDAERVELGLGETQRGDEVRRRWSAGGVARRGRRRPPGARRTGCRRRRARSARRRGRGVSAVMPASSSARPLTQAVWPSAASRGRPAGRARPGRGRRGAGRRPGSPASTSRRRGSTARPGATRHTPR